MKTKLSLGIGMVAFLVGFGVWAITATIQNDTKRSYHIGGLPKMEPVGEFSLNNRSVYVFGFEFEGKRCIWMERLKHAGLTCWDVK